MSAQKEIHDESVNSIYDICYENYKKEYASDEDFSIQDEDISQELNSLLECYDFHFKKRRFHHSNSIYSEILENLVIEKRVEMVCINKVVNEIFNIGTSNINI